MVHARCHSFVLFVCPGRSDPPQDPGVWKERERKIKKRGREKVNKGREREKETESERCSLLNKQERTNFGAEKRIGKEKENERKGMLAPLHWRPCLQIP